MKSAVTSTSVSYTHLDVYKRQDEAHERSLNIDFILGYLRQLLPKRPDLKVIITSATIDPERFAEHFADADNKPAPIIEVSGRTFPVAVSYTHLDVYKRQVPW